MKLYIAGNNQEEARAVAGILRAAGHTITSRWLEEDFSRTSEYTEQDRERIASIDLEDVTLADALVICASPRRVPGGKFVEAGIAMGQGKTVYVLGHRENMLLWHPQVKRFDSVENFISDAGISLTKGTTPC